MKKVSEMIINVNYGDIGNGVSQTGYCSPSKLFVFQLQNQAVLVRGEVCWRRVG